MRKELTMDEARVKYVREWPVLNDALLLSKLLGDRVACKRWRQRLSKLSLDCAARHPESEVFEDLTVDAVE